jgi:hypothetical protein
MSDTVRPVYSGDCAICLSRAVASRRTAGSGGRVSMIRQPRRLMSTSGRPPIGWPQRGPGVRQPHLP